MKYRLYVDEVGDDSLKSASDENHRYLSLTGVAMNKDHVRDVLTPKLNALKSSIFQHDPDEPVILHRSDIVNKKGIFGVLNDPQICAAFDQQLLSIISDVEYTVITAVIDKLEMQNQTHWSNQHPYHYLMEILVEKYVQWLERQEGMGDVMPEKRQGKKDTALQIAYQRVVTHGLRFVNRDRIKARLPGTKLKFRTKPDNISGLQLCDLIAHPSHMNVRHIQGHSVTLGPFAQRVIPILMDDKYDRSIYNRIRGYGIKYQP